MFPTKTAKGARVYKNPKSYSTRWYYGERRGSKLIVNRYIYIYIYIRTYFINNVVVPQVITSGCVAAFRTAFRSLQCTVTPAHKSGEIPVSRVSAARGPHYRGNRSWWGKGARHNTGAEDIGKRCLYQNLTAVLVKTFNATQKCFYQSRTWGLSSVI